MNPYPWYEKAQRVARVGEIPRDGAGESEGNDSGFVANEGPVSRNCRAGKETVSLQDRQLYRDGEPFPPDHPTWRGRKSFPDNAMDLERIRPGV